MCTANIGLIEVLGHSCRCGKKPTASITGEDQKRLGGIGSIVAEAISKNKNIEVRTTVLGHLQRGGAPTAYDRLLATRFGEKAVDMVANGEFNRMAAIQGGEMTSVPISDVVGKQRKVPLDSQLIKVAQSVGTSFGWPINR